MDGLHALAQLAGWFAVLAAALAVKPARRR